MKKHTVWIFYLITEHEVYGTDPKDIYAYTTDMNLAACFAKQRDMDKFYMKKVKISNEDINKLYKEYMDENLVEIKSTTRKGNKMKSTNCNVVLTRRESVACMNCASLYTNEYLYRNLVVNPMVFRKKYQRALMTVRYLPLYEHLKGVYIIHDDVYKNMHPDMLNIVLDNFGELFYEKESG